MKILVVSNMYPDDKHPFYGTFVKNFCNQLNEINIPYQLSVMYKGDSKLAKAINYGLFYITTFVKVVFGKFDIIYIHYASHSSVPVIFASKFKKNLNIYTNLHGSDVVPENKKQERMQKYTKSIISISKKVIVPSEYFKKYVINKYNIDSDKLFVYPSGGINPEVFYPLENKDLLCTKGKYNLEENKKYITYVSRISKDKGWDVFCLALKEVISNDKNNEIRGIIVGSGDEYEQLEILINELGLKDKLSILPSLSQSQLNEIYNCIDCLVFPSKREGESLGLIPLEAMSAETLVIVNDFAAPGEYINDKINGLKYECNNYIDLANTILDCMNMSNEEKNEIKKNAKETSSKYYVKTIKKDLERIFK